MKGAIISLTIVGAILLGFNLYHQHYIQSAVDLGIVLVGMYSIRENKN